mmetsp:Transcript_65712/g.153780  ORF Transcript_65712/g.153780 Transcript_65712/m.153780 type:complete len:238 (-) Transcript_65712:73-786(-)
MKSSGSVCFRGLSESGPGMPSMSKDTCLSGSFCGRLMSSACLGAALLLAAEDDAGGAFVAVEAALCTFLSPMTSSSENIPPGISISTTERAGAEGDECLTLSSSSGSKRDGSGAGRGASGSSANACPVIHPRMPVYPLGFAAEAGAEGVKSGGSREGSDSWGREPAEASDSLEYWCPFGAGVPCSQLSQLFEAPEAGGDSTSSSASSWASKTHSTGFVCGSIPQIVRIHPRLGAVAT